MLKGKVTCLILSCDKFSDLWESNIKLYKENWPDADFSTILVTDKHTDRKISGIQIISCGENLEWSDRLAIALNYVETKYVFVTLDDYFLIERVDSNKMVEYLDLMERDDFDYLRFFSRPTRATLGQVKDYPGLYYVNSSCEYSVNLYPGFWRKKFLSYTIIEGISAWEFEVCLHKLAVKYGAKCICSNNREYHILDVVRKGKILHSANAYFKRHPGTYDGDRPVQSWSFEVKLWMKTEIGRHTPRFLLKLFRKIYVKLGGSSFVVNDNYSNKI